MMPCDDSPIENIEACLGVDSQVPFADVVKRRFFDFVPSHRPCRFSPSGFVWDGFTLWYNGLHHTASFSVHHIPEWDERHFFAHENGGRLAHECFDFNFAIGRMGGSFTLWTIGGWSRLLRLFPTRDRKRLVWR